MKLSILCLKGTGLPLSDDEYVLLSTVAQQLASSSEKDAGAVTFNHAGCSGTLIRGKAAAIGGTAGTVFHADISEANKKRFVDFMLPASHERTVSVDDETVIEIGISTETIGRVEMSEVSPSPNMQDSGDKKEPEVDGDGYVVVPD